MKQDVFERAHEAEWAAFEALLDGGKGDLPRAYRRVCQHLALARHRRYTAGLVRRLDQLVLRGHQELYGASLGFSWAWGTFLAGGFARAVRRLAVPVLLALVLFGLPFGGLALGARRNPELATLVESPQALARMESMYRSGAQKFGRQDEADADVQMFGLYIWNNVRIGFQCFATGLLLGVGSAFYLVFNGLHGGAVAGWLTHAGLGGNFWSFVVTHSALELPSLVLSGGAGLHLGWSLLAPGRRTRRQALREGVAEALPVVTGAALMDVLAAALEAFWSSSAALPPAVKYAAGGFLWTAVLAYFLLAGRRHAA